MSNKNIIDVATVDTLTNTDSLFVNSSGSLKQIPMGDISVGGVSITKLWENASPGSDFPEQSINIDLSDYTMIAIHSRPLKQYTREVCNIFRVDCGIGYLSETYSAASSATVKIHNRSRQVSFSPSITFYKANAYSGVFYESVIDTLVPVVIYGIKGVA